jgi:hypothetical protein
MPRKLVLGQRRVRHVPLWDDGASRLDPRVSVCRERVCAGNRGHIGHEHGYYADRGT